MNFIPSHTPKHSHARLGAAIATLGVVALIAGCGSSSNSSTITVGNESTPAPYPT
jgi:hypothetical protein